MTQILWDILAKKYLAVEFAPLLQFSQIAKIGRYCSRIQMIQRFIIQFTSFRISCQNMFLYHPIQMSLNRSTTYVPIATFLSRCTAYYTIKISEACRCKFRIFSWVDDRHKQKQSKCLVNKMHLSLHHIMHDYSIIGVSIWSDRVLFQSVLLKTSLLSLLYFFIFSMSSKSKLIAVSEKTYHELAAMGTLEDSFNSVIERMIEIQKAAMSGPTLAGTGQSIAAAPLNLPNPNQSRRSKRVK